MSKTKAAAKVTSAPEILSGNQPVISTTQATDSKIPALSIRILYQGNWPKLTTRCRGDLTYELGSAMRLTMPRSESMPKSAVRLQQWIAWTIGGMHTKKI